jgi:hypothetical protein
LLSIEKKFIAYDCRFATQRLYEMNDTGGWRSGSRTKSVTTNLGKLTSVASHLGICLCSPEGDNLGGGIIPLTPKLSNGFDIILSDMDGNHTDLLF